MTHSWMCISFLHLWAVCMHKLWAETKHVLDLPKHAGQTRQSDCGHQSTPADQTILRPCSYFILLCVQPLRWTKQELHHGKQSPMPTLIQSMISLGLTVLDVHGYKKRTDTHSHNHPAINIGQKIFNALGEHPDSHLDPRGDLTLCPQDIWSAVLLCKVPDAYLSFSHTYK